jgi:hypothetical protein
VLLWITVARKHEDNRMDVYITRPPTREDHWRFQPSSHQR